VLSEQTGNPQRDRVVDEHSRGGRNQWLMKGGEGADQSGVDAAYPSW
jgi:hypothetical protein